MLRASTSGISFENLPVIIQEQLKPGEEIKRICILPRTKDNSAKTEYFTSLGRKLTLKAVVEIEDETPANSEF